MAAIPVASAVYSADNIPMAAIHADASYGNSNYIDFSPPALPFQRSLEEPNPALKHFNLRFDEAAAREYLSRCEWPLGLQDTFIRNLSKIPLRFFICDDSGSVCIINNIFNKITYKSNMLFSYFADGCIWWTQDFEGFARWNKVVYISTVSLSWILMLFTSLLLKESYLALGGQN